MFGKFEEIVKGNPSTLVILSGATTSRSKVVAKSKDPLLASGAIGPARSS
jgi:hypothetical protein